MHEIYIDYLQFNGFSDERTVREMCRKVIDPIPFYKRGYEMQLGNRIYFGNPNSKRALHIHSGKSLENYRKAEWDMREVVDDILTQNGTITRMDIAITDYDIVNLYTPQKVAELCESGLVSGTLAKYGYTALSKANVGQPSSIETTYIGAMSRRGKMGIFRAYDKGVELDILPNIMARLELEEKREKAHASAKRYASGETLSRIMQSRIEFNHKSFERFIDGDPIDMSRGEQFNITNDDEKMEKRWTWLMSQVVPALREAVSYDRENELGDSRTLEFLQKSGIIV